MECTYVICWYYTQGMWSGGGYIQKHVAIFSKHRSPPSAGFSAPASNDNESDAGESRNRYCQHGIYASKICTIIIVMQ